MARYFNNKKELLEKRLARLENLFNKKSSYVKEEWEDDDDEFEEWEEEDDEDDDDLFIEDDFVDEGCKKHNKKCKGKDCEDEEMNERLRCQLESKVRRLEHFILNNHK